MIKETITYNDFNGVVRTEDFYFNLSEAEIAEMQMSTSGGFDEMIKKIIAAQDTPALIRIFKDLVLKAYGEKSDDGKRFMKKNGELAEAFAETNAYSKLFMKLATNADDAIRFINGILPADLPREEANEAALKVVAEIAPQA